MGCKLSPIFLVFLIVSLVFSGYQIREAKAVETFGKTDIGGSENNSGDDEKIGCKFTLVENGDVSKLTFYCKSASGGNVLLKGLIYDDNAGAPNALEGTSGEISFSDEVFTWRDLTFGASVSLVAGDYWLGVIIGTSAVRYVYDGGAANQLAYDADAYADGPEDPFGEPTGYVAWNVSIYATYTTEEGQDLSFSLFENFNVWDSSSKAIETSNTLFQSFNTWESMAFNKEVGFKLYEPFNLWSYLATSKEQSFTFFENFDLWSSLSHTTEGVALDLYFTFFEAFNPYASLGTVLEEELTLDDVYGLAALGFIMAIVAICLAVAFKKK